MRTFVVKASASAVSTSKPHRLDSQSPIVCISSLALNFAAGNLNFNLFSKPTLLKTLDKFQ